MRATGLVAALLAAVAAADSDPKYAKGDVVRVYATHVGPAANPSETYPFYVLPYCPPKDGFEAGSQDLGESFSGDQRVNTPYEFRFLQDQDNVDLCERELTENDIVRAAQGGAVAR